MLEAAVDLVVPESVRLVVGLAFAFVDLDVDAASSLALAFIMISQHSRS